MLALQLSIQRMAYCAFIGLIFGSMVPASHAVPSTCNRLPDAVLAYIKTLDPQAIIREDCLAILSKERSYLPVLPQSHDAEAPPTTVLEQYPKNSSSPDWVAFNNGYYLLRLIETANGKITLPRTDTIPAGLKTGLIPQNFMVPAGFSIPSELRVIVGDLPYETPSAINPKLSVTPLDKRQIPPRGLEQVTENLTQANTIEDPVLFTASLKQSTFTAWDAIAWQPKWQVDFQCLSTSVASSLNGEYLYANCLNKPRINVIDVQSQQRINELELEDVAHELQHHPYYPEVVALHRYADKLTFIDSEFHLVRAELKLPHPVEQLAMHQRLPLAYAINSAGDKILEIDLQQQNILRQFTVEAEENAEAANAETQAPPTRGKVDTAWIDDTRGRFGVLWYTGKNRPYLDAFDLFEGRRVARLTLPFRFQRAFFPADEGGQVQKNPVLVGVNELGESQSLTLAWKDKLPALNDAQPLENPLNVTEGDPLWMAFSPGTQKNKGFGVEANTENVYGLQWNADTERLSVLPPVVEGTRSKVLLLVQEPSPERLKALKDKREAFAPNAGETEILQSLRTRPQRQNWLERLGGWLKFAPRDQ